MKIEEVSALLGTLPSAGVPMALLPVQVQTRYVTRDGQAQLLVRVYPDDVHVDSHEPALTAAEAEWGRRYWELIWPAAGDDEARQQAWAALADRFGARRAAWIARRLTPTNPDDRPTPHSGGAAPVFPAVDPLKDDAWTLPAMARLLPDRWVVAGYVGGVRLILEVGAPIPDALQVSLAPNDSDEAPVGDDEIAIDAGLRWMVDFETAEKVGMGLRISLNADLATRRLDRLLVFGVKNSASAAQAAALFENQLDIQRYTRGLALLGPGTPTNNTAEASSSFERRSPQGKVLPVDVRPPALEARTDGSLAARLLGVGGRLIAPLDGASQSEDLDARSMQTALWPVTGAYYLQQVLAQPEGRPPLVSREELDAARRWFIDFVRPSGPLPALRVGRQPYGLLPVQSLDLRANGSPGEERFILGLRMLRSAWRNALDGVTRLQAGGQNSGDLVEILRMQPASVGYRTRLAFDSQFFAPSGLVQTPLDPNLRSHRVLLRERLRSAGADSLLDEARVFNLLPWDAARRWPSALVQPGEDVPGAALDPNYITFLRSASFDDILAEHFPEGGGLQVKPVALLYLLLRHAVLLAYVETAARILERRGSLPGGAPLEPVLVDVLGELRPARSRTLLRVIDLDPDLRASIHTLGAANEPEAAVLDELRGALGRLETLPADRLQRLMAGCLDLFSYRLDAWITSLATQRLTEARTQRPNGLALGGFGWVEDLEPALRTPAPLAPPGENSGPLFSAHEAGGFLLAPSMGQAAAAGVLRSGYLTQPGENGSRPFAVDLSSARVRLARWLLEGLRQGQSLGALLGYRFERGLHDRRLNGISLDRFIAGFRRVGLLASVYRAQENLAEAITLPPGPLRFIRIREAQLALSMALFSVRQAGSFPPGASVEALEAIAIARPVDGLALARLFEGGAFPLDRAAPPGGPGLTVAERAVLQAELQALLAAVDALSDALTAEGVYGVVQGNPVRAAASVDAIAHGDIDPPELSFTETPRAGAAVTHRLAVIFSGPVPTSPAGARQFRAKAEPRLDAWLRQMLGELRNVVCQAEFLDEGGGVIGGKVVNLTLATLGISHLDAVLLSASARPGQPTDLERLLEYRFRRDASPQTPASARVRLLYARPATGLTAAQLSLGQFLEIAAAFRRAILTARPLAERDLAPPEGAPAGGLDAAGAAEFARRASAAVDGLRRAQAALVTRIGAVERAQPAALAAQLDLLRERLLDLFATGSADALPFSPRGASASEKDVLLVQARATAQEAARRLEQIQALESPFERAGAEADLQVRHDLERLRLVFGKSFLALPQLHPPNAQALGSAFGASESLQGGDPLQALSWLQGMSRVRPGAAALDAALSYAAALGRPAALDLRVAQLPFEAGDRWTALPVPPGGTLKTGTLSLVAHLPAVFRPTQPLAGFVADEWVEVIPADQLTAGLAFQYDAPGARPPQAILLALAPQGAERWDLEALEATLLETLDLAQIRAVDPQALSGETLFQRLLPALYVSQNLSGDTISTDFSHSRG